MTVGPVGSSTMYIDLSQVESLDLKSKAQFATEADRQVFLDAVSNARELEKQGILNPILEIPKPVNAEMIGLTVDALETLSGAFSDMIGDVMKALHELGVQMRQAAKSQRGAEREQEQQKLLDAANKIREAAAWALAAGVVSGVMAIGSAGITAVGAARAGYTASQGGAGAADGPDIAAPKSKVAAGVDGSDAPVVTRSRSNAVSGDAERPVLTRTRSNAVSGESNRPQLTSDAPDTGKSPSKLSQLKEKILRSKESDLAGTMASPDGAAYLAQVQNARYTAANQGLEGLSTIIKSALEYQSKQAEADQQVLQAQARKEGYDVEDANEIVQNTLGMIRDVQQKLGEILQAGSQIESKIWN